MLFVFLFLQTSFGEDYIYAISQNNEVTITGYTGDGGGVVIPDTIDGYPVVRVASSTFDGNTNITSVTIPEKISSIEFCQFRDCINLVSVSFPAGISDIGSRAFEGCVRLISIPPLHSVTNIGTYAFEYCKELTSVEISGSKTHIESSAFSYCEKLSTVTLLNGIASIGDRAFSDCAKLVSVTLPETVTYIGDYAFGACTKLRALYFDGIPPALGTDPFYGINSEAKVYYLNDNMGWGPSFSGLPVSPWTLDVAYTITPSNTVTIIEYMGSGGDVYIPREIENKTVTTIGNSAFYRGTNITSIALPSTITYIGQSAFSICTKLTDITIPKGVRTIGAYAFSFCDNLDFIFIPSSISTIGESMFYGCDSLSNVHIENGITAIEAEAFGFCYGLESITIPSSVNLVESNSFYNCLSLSGVYFRGDAPAVESTAFNAVSSRAIAYYLEGSSGWQATLGGIPTAVWHPGYEYKIELSGDIEITKYRGAGGDVSIPAQIGARTVVAIGEGAFSRNNDIISVAFPTGLESINDLAFHDCWNLTHIYLSQTIKNIGKQAFANCNSLTSVYIPAGVFSINGSAFLNCPQLTEFQVDASNPTYGSTNGLIFSKNYDAIIASPTGKTGAYEIPDGVIQINNDAFKESRISELTIPEGVSSIGSIFDTCRELERISIPSTVSEIVDYAFFYCGNLEVIFFQGKPPTLIGSNPFYGAPLNAKVYYVEGTPGWPSILGGLQTVAINTDYEYEMDDDNRVTITEYNGTNDMVVIPHDIGGHPVVRIADGVFKGCTNITSVKVSADLVEIGDEAFANCSNLVTILFPHVLGFIGDRAFESCARLQGLYFLGATPNCKRLLDHPIGKRLIP
jgi:hypothetical protein